MRINEVRTITNSIHLWHSSVENMLWTNYFRYLHTHTTMRVLCMSSVCLSIYPWNTLCYTTDPPLIVTFAIPKPIAVVLVDLRMHGIA